MLFLWITSDTPYIKVKTNSYVLGAKGFKYNTNNGLEAFFCMVLFVTKCVKIKMVFGGILTVRWVMTVFWTVISDATALIWKGHGPVRILGQDFSIWRLLQCFSVCQSWPNWWTWRLRLASLWCFLWNPSSICCNGDLLKQRVYVPLWWYTWARLSWSWEQFPKLSLSTS